MPITIFTGRDFNQDVSKAKRATKKGPVTITDRDRPTHVLLGAEDHESFIRRQASIADLLVIPDAADIEFDQQSLEGKLFGMTDLS